MRWRDRGDGKVRLMLVLLVSGLRLLELKMGDVAVMLRGVLRASSVRVEYAGRCKCPHRPYSRRRTLLPGRALETVQLPVARKTGDAFTEDASQHKATAARPQIAQAGKSASPANAKTAA